MQNLFYLHSEKFFFFGIVFARLGAMLMTAPLFSARVIPLHVRIVSVFVLTTLITPLQWQSNSGVDLNSYSVFFHVLANVVIGASLGLTMLILFSGVQVAGSVICRSGQMALEPCGNDPVAIEGPAASRILQWLALIIFVAMGGHRLMMTALLDSFQSIPLATHLLPERLLQIVVHMVGESFRLAIRIAAPVVTALLASTLAIGLVSRALPQINAFSIGLAINLWSTFWTLFFSLAIVAYLFGDYLNSFFSTWSSMLSYPG